MPLAADEGDTCKFITDDDDPIVLLLLPVTLRRTSGLTLAMQDSEEGSMNSKALSVLLSFDCCVCRKSQDTASNDDTLTMATRRCTGNGASAMATLVITPRVPSAPMNRCFNG